MSTDIHLVCHAHDPVIISDEVGTTNSIDTVVKQIQNREKIVKTFLANIELGVWPDFEGYERTVWYFFLHHPTCELGIRDEYGKDIEVDGTEQEASQGEQQ
jgi:hypothetical protein